MGKLLLFLFISISLALGNYYEQELEYTNLNTWGLFGQTISSFDNQMAVYGDQSIYLFQSSDEYGWTETDIITVMPFTIAQNTFAIRDNLLVIGGWDSPQNFIFQYNQNSWTLTDSIIYPDSSIQMSGGNIFITNTYVMTTISTDTDRMIGYYDLYLNQWNLSRTFEIPSDYSYYKNAYDNEIFLSYPAWDNPDGTINQGITYFYQFINNQWVGPTVIEPSLAINYINYGYSLLRTENYLFIGAPIQGDGPYAGFVFVYQSMDGEWVEQQILTIGDVQQTIGFGYSIDGNDSTIVVGAPYSQDAGQASGAAYIFKNFDGIWQQVKKIISSDLVNGDMFGTTVSMTDDFVFVGAPLADGLEGAVYVYDPHDTTLHANFAGDVRNGNAPVTVQFTSVPQGNPTVYEWDFNSDGFVDSTEPNPQFTYQINGTYTVTLSVYDETGSDAEVKTDYIQVVSDILFGDVNGDGSLDVSDLVMYIDFILGYSEPEEDQFLAGDVNYSGQIDIIDIVMVIDEILE